MKKTPVTKSGRRMVVVALSALLPVTAVLADDRDPYRPYHDQGTSGAQGPMRSDIDSATPTYSGEDRRQFQDETPGAQGPVRSDADTMERDSTPMQTQRDPYDSSLRGAEGPTRSDLEAQGYTGDRMSSRDMAACPSASSTSEKFAPNAYYGESNPFYSADGKASFFGKGRWC